MKRLSSVVALVLAMVAVLLLESVPWADATPSAMPSLVLATPCGSTLADDPPDPEPPPGTGHVCDGLRACQACFYSAGACYSCGETKSYKVCVTGTGTCLNDSHVVSCGRAFKHQDGGSIEECQTCIGSGTQAGGCNKNSCHGALVVP